MPPPSLDRKRVEALLLQAGDRLDGEWVLLGGALALVWLGSPRSTRDIDLISTQGSHRGRLALMELAEENGLPIEAVNPAADFFLRRIDGWERMLEPLHRGKRAIIHRPNPTLFLISKLRRLSESDMEDCLLLLQRCTEHGWMIDAERVRTEIASLPEVETDDDRKRRKLLLDALPTP